MTKEEYIEFTNLQEHYEWLHAAEDGAKTKLETFTTDDSEFDELVREAVKVYFETEINKAWKKIEEFKTATAKTGNVRLRCLMPKMAVFKNHEGRELFIDFEVLKNAVTACNSRSCDDNLNKCPFKNGSYEWFKDAFERGCLDIYEMYWRGEYKIIEGDK